MPEISPPVERALISVSDKSNLLEFAAALVRSGVEIYASGGTRTHLEEAGIAVREVAQYTGFPELLDGRLKTLHPKVHGAILARRDQPADMRALAEHGIVTFELVVVNLYPFEETVARPETSFPQAVEQIDIGGPTLLRAAAKNHAHVAVACHPSQYARIAEQIAADGRTTPELRRELAGAAFAHTARYDEAIAAYFARVEAKAGAVASAPESTPALPTQRSLSLQHRAALRYGENPHQPACLYDLPGGRPGSLACAEQLHGKELSYNNYLDLDSAVAAVRTLPAPGVVVIKHNNPCGAATASTVGEATRMAWEGDPQSAFGSVLGFNAPVDAASAEFLAGPDRFVEAIVAPDFTPEAYQILTTRPKWKANVRLLKIGAIPPGEARPEYRQIDGGLLCQSRDDLPDDETEWSVVTKEQPTDAQWAELRFAWAACRHVKSNAIVLARDGALVGVGAGQMSRVDSVHMAILKAGERARGAVLASDAFFPFDDSIRQAAAAGVSAVIQPGGSRRDEQVVSACDELRLPMVFTGRRHFRH